MKFNEYILLINFLMLKYFIFTKAVALHHSVILSLSQQPAPNIVLIHGLLGSSRNFGNFARILYDKLNG